MELIDLVNSVIIFLSQTTIFRYFLIVLFFCIYLFLMAFYLFYNGFPSIGKFWSVYINFPINSKQDAPFHCLANDSSGADWDGLCDYLRDVQWENIFQLGASAAASEFYECIHLGIDVFISHRKYQVKPHSSPWFSVACAVHSSWFSVACA